MRRQRYWLKFCAATVSCSVLLLLSHNYELFTSSETNPRDTLIGHLARAMPIIELEKPIVYGVFENATTIFMSRGFKKLLAELNLDFKQISSQDSRLLNKWKNESKADTTLTHIIIHSNEVVIFHIPILIPRSSYYWIGPMPTDSNLNFIWKNADLKRWLRGVAIDGRILNNLKQNPDEVSTIADQKTFQWHMKHSRFLECHYEENVWPFWSFYGSSVESYDRNLVRNALQFVRELSLSNLVPLEMYGGTLLGWYRQCDFIPYTKDLDFITNATDMTDSFFQTLFHSSQLYLSERFGTPNSNLGLEMSGFYRKQLKIDFFTWIYDNNTAYAYYYLMEYYAVQRLAYPRSELCTCDLLGVLVYITCNPEKQIATEYGDKWFEPIVGALSRNFTTLKLYQDSEDDMKEYKMLHHMYKSRNCSNPSIMYGCD